MSLFEIAMSDADVVEVRGDELEQWVRALEEGTAWIPQNVDLAARVRAAGFVSGVKVKPGSGEGATFGRHTHGRDWYVGAPPKDTE